jgi:hypothetical protein
MNTNRRIIVVLAALLGPLVNGVSAQRAATHRVKLLNQSVQVRFANSGPRLICGNTEEPEELNVPVPPEYAGPVDTSWPFRVSTTSLGYQVNCATCNPPTFDITRVLTVQADSDEILKAKVAPYETHGCDSELYPTGSRFDVNGDTLTLNATVFAAARWCPIDDHSTCGAEAWMNGTYSFTIKQDQQYDECTTGRSPFWLLLNSAGPPTLSGSDSGCAGRTRVDAAAILGQVSVPGAKFNRSSVPGALEFNSDAVPKRSLFGAKHYKKVKLSDPVAFCPSGSSVVKLSDKKVQVEVREAVKNLPEPWACRLYPRTERSLLVVADHATPTRRIEVVQNDTWWRLAERSWGDGRLNPLLRKANPNVRILRPGNILTVPDLGSLLKDTRLVEEGDSLWSLSNKLHQPRGTFRSLAPRVYPKIDNPNRIYPFYWVELEKK